MLGTLNPSVMAPRSSSLGVKDSLGHGRRAFTLVELLVVIGIIAVLMSLLLPSLARARRQAQISQCASNLRQLGVAVFAYLADHKQKYPQYGEGNRASAAASVYQNNKFYVWGTQVATAVGTTEDRLLDPYTQKLVAQCPLERGYRGVTGFGPGIDGRTFFDIYGSSYCYNVGLEDSTAPNDPANGRIRYVLWNISSGQLRNASNLVMGGDFTLIYAEYFTKFKAAGFAHYAMTQTHSDRKYDCNILFADGHVHSTEIKPAPNHLDTGDYRLTREPMLWPFN
jgi:prepilin-type N-terminal cleavage/methylation domain-containing protein/prepilin-type processing-associated H-X9-DG protein